MERDKVMSHALLSQRYYCFKWISNNSPVWKAMMWWEQDYCTVHWIDDDTHRRKIDKDKKIWNKKNIKILLLPLFYRQIKNIFLCYLIRVY